MWEAPAKEADYMYAARARKQEAFLAEEGKKDGRRVDGSRL